jgi:hypothetical protein
MRVFERGRGPRFISEPRELPFIEHAGQRQHLERHSPAQRKLFRFVDDPHASAADLTHNAEVA